MTLLMLSVLLLLHSVFCLTSFIFRVMSSLTRSTQEETDDLNRFLYGPDAFSVIQTTVLKCWSNSVS